MINEYGEIIRDAEVEVEEMSRRKCFEDLANQLEEICQSLNEANSESLINAVLNKAAKDFENLFYNRQVEEVRGIIADAIGMLNKIKLRDATRNELANLLQVMLERVKSIIEEEKSREKTERLKKLLLAMVENSDEIAKIIGLDEILA